MILEDKKMFRAKRKYGSNREKTRLSSCQNGSILLGIIITMVVMAVLGAGMVYLTTTSTFQELFANNNTRAYYAAEAGGRYATALIRQSLATGTPPFSDLDIPQPVIFSTSYSMGNSGSFQITNWQPTGFLSKVVTFDSIGTVGSGFLQAKRRLTYKIHPANQGGLTLPPLIPPEVSDFDVPKNVLDEYFSPVDMSEVDIKDNPKVDGDNALNLKADEYTTGLNWGMNLSLAQLDKIRANNGNLLSYGVQVKIYDYDEDTLQASPYNIIGISFRLDDSNDGTMTDDIHNMYGFSFVKLKKPATPPTVGAKPAWYSTYFYNTTYTNTDWDIFSTGTSTDNMGKWFVVLWKRIYNGSAWSYVPLAYQKLTLADTACRTGSATDCTKLTHWSTIMVYVYEKSGGTNEITGYLSSPPTYLRRTTDDPQTILWAEKDKAPNPDTVPDKFQPISWTVVWELWELTHGYIVGNRVNVNSDGDAYICTSDHTSTALDKPGTGANWTTYWSKLSRSSFIQDSSLTTLNYANYTPGIGDPVQTKAREIGLHIFDMSTSAQNIYYDNFYIDLSPSIPVVIRVDGTGLEIRTP